MPEDKPDLATRRQELADIFTKQVVLSGQEKELLAELVRGAELCFANAEQLFQEASLLREHKHLSRSIFLYQIAMEECAKVDMIGAAATSLTVGHPIDLAALSRAFRDHKAKNFTNAYMSKASEAERAAVKANDAEVARKAFKHSQAEIHRYFNRAKNASMYVDFAKGKFVAPDDVVTEDLAFEIAAVSYYFMTITAPRLPPLRRMIEDPTFHAELMTGLGEAMKKALAANSSIEEMEATMIRHIQDMAASIGAKKNDTSASD